MCANAQDAFAVALGEIAAACKSPAAEEAVKALEAKKPGKVPTLQRMLADGVSTCLAGPLVAAVSAGHKEAAAALAQAWLAYLAALQAMNAIDEAKLVDLAIMVTTAAAFPDVPDCMTLIGARAQSCADWKPEADSWCQRASEGWSIVPCIPKACVCEHQTSFASARHSCWTCLGLQAASRLLAARAS